MADSYSIKLGKLIELFSLEKLVFAENDGERQIMRKEVNRPGLYLAGFHEYFYPDRIQILGKTEYEYLEHLSEKDRNSAVKTLMEQRPICVILTHARVPLPITVECAQTYGVPLLITPEETSLFMANLIGELNVALAERITTHGVLVEVYGEGVLLLGDSSVGKSETAIDLVKRGHRLVADDAVEIKRVSDHTLVGTAPEMIRHYVELRGIGVVDVCRLFGMGAVKETEKIDLVVQLEHWEQGKSYERLGLDTDYTEILGVRVPCVTVPVRPGRNLALIIEIATMNMRQKLMGFNTAEELDRRLKQQMEGEE